MFKPCRRCRDDTTCLVATYCHRVTVRPIEILILSRCFSQGIFSDIRITPRLLPGRICFARAPAKMSKNSIMTDTDDGTTKVCLS